MRAASPLPHATIWQRAALVRSFVERLTLPGPPADVWASCCEPLAALMDASDLSIVLRTPIGDEVVCALIDGLVRPPAAGSLELHAIAAEVFAANATIVHESAHRAGALVGVPIRFGTTLLGAICVVAAGQPDSELITLLESCALSAGARVHTEALASDTARFERLALADALTGLANRRRFDETLAAEWSRAARTGTPLTLLMMDVDHFKLFNDAYGHPAGDACLRQVAAAVASAARRAGDLCARYGGEEFVALLPGVNGRGGARVAESLMARVADLRVAHCASSLGRVSLSVGVASLVPSADTGPEALVAAADAALYEAKGAGRNQLRGAGYLAAVDPQSALVVRDAPPSNLPRQHTRLIGRLKEVAEITALLDTGSLVTLSACGGAGKTRLSIAIAAELSGRFADGAWFVDLARISDPALIPAAIGALFRLEIPAGESAVRILAGALAAKRSLLVFDNCEHVLAGTAEIAAELLAACAGVKILATSREPLGIRGESVYGLPLLSVPSAEPPVDAQRALDYDAIALFTERAKAARRDFALTDDNAATVGAICRQLDGIALEIELAAARVSVISVGEIAKRLGERFRLLRGGDRSALPRQQTMRALIDWSYDLLALEEQLVFRRLSVFAGGWTLEAMTEICAGGDLDADDVFDLLCGLVRKSLVVETIGDDASRYRLLESVREYALEKLHAEPECDDLRRRHAGYYLRFADAAKARHFFTPSQKWQSGLQPEAENFRAALHWSLAQGHDIRLGSALAGSLVTFLVQVSPSESLRWTRLALDLLTPDSEPAIEAALWYGLGRAAENLPADQMRVAAERAVALNRTVGDPLPLGEALRQLILVLGWFYPAEREMMRELAREAMRIARDLGEPVQIALALRSVCVTLDDDDFAQKHRVLEESLALLLAHGNDLQTAVAFMWLAEIHFCSGDAHKASIYAREAMRFAEDSGSASMLAQMATNFAQYTVGEGDWEATRRAAAEAAENAGLLGMDDQVTWAVQALAFVSAGTGDYLTAARLLGFCDSRVGTLHSQRQVNGVEDILYRRLRAMLEARLDPTLLDVTLRGGTRLTVGEALQAGVGFAAAV